MCDRNVFSSSFEDRQEEILGMRSSSKLVRCAGSCACSCFRLFGLVRSDVALSVLLLLDRVSYEDVQQAARIYGEDICRKNDAI